MKFILIAYFFVLGCNYSKNTNSTKPIATTTAIQSAKASSKHGAWLKAAKLYEQLYLADSTNEKLNYETGTNFLKANYPQKALAILINFDEKYQDKTTEFNGRIARIAKAYYQIGAYEKILDLVRNYDYPKMYRGLAREHLKALIQLNKLADLAKAFTNYQQNGIYDDKGEKTNEGFLHRAICNEYLVVGNANLSKKYAENYYKWAILRQEKDKRNLAISVFYQQDFTKAIPYLEEAIATEKSARHQMELVGLLGICYAKNGALEKVLEQIIIIQNLDPLPNRHDAFGAKFYHTARIQVALNQPEEAIQSLKQAVAAKAEFWSNRFREDGLLKELFEQADFKTLVKFRE